MLKTIEAIELFLENWKKMAHEYYTKLRDEYKKESKKEYEITEENLKCIRKYHWEPTRKYTDEQIKNIMVNINGIPEHDKRRLQSQINHNMIKAWERRHTKAEIAIIERMWEDGYLEKLLTKDVESKRKAFISRVEKKVGNIIDASDLRIAENGEINGIVIGDKGKARVETITAGGYNVQCYHYRVLVKEIKS